jgi:hypothetical protein
MEEDKKDEKLEAKNKEENLQVADIDSVGTSGKKKTPPKKLKKVLENNAEDNGENLVEKKKVETVSEKNKPESHAKSRKATSVKEPKKRKLFNKKKDNCSIKGEIVNNCVVDLGSKEKISPKSKIKSRSAKLKQKLQFTVNTDIDDSHKEGSEKSSFNTSNQVCAFLVLSSVVILTLIFSFFLNYQFPPCLNPTLRHFDIFYFLQVCVWKILEILT